jgi:hypothetical protein
MALGKGVIAAERLAALLAYEEATADAELFVTDGALPGRIEPIFVAA